MADLISIAARLLNWPWTHYAPSNATRWKLAAERCARVSRSIQSASIWRFTPKRMARAGFQQLPRWIGRFVLLPGSKASYRPR